MEFWPNTENILRLNWYPQKMFYSEVIWDLKQSLISDFFSCWQGEQITNRLLSNGVLLYTLFKQLLLKHYYSVGSSWILRYLYSCLMVDDSESLPDTFRVVFFPLKLVCENNRDLVSVVLTDKLFAVNQRSPSDISIFKLVFISLTSSHFRWACIVRYPKIKQYCIPSTWLCSIV